MSRYEIAWTGTFVDGSRNDGVYSGDHKSASEAKKAAMDHACAVSKKHKNEVVRFQIVSPGGASEDYTPER